MSGRTLAGGACGPLCDHKEPTVLTEVNGTKMYVCRRYPRNHCGKWCTADVALVPMRPAEQPAALTPRGGGGAASPAAAVQQADGDTVMLGSPASPAGEGLEEEEEGSTPSQQLGTPRIPAAPSKSNSQEGRPQPSTAARSLSQVFNRLTPAAIRASQLGARYVTLRPDSRAMARMQQRASAPVSPAVPGGSGGSQPAARKRARVSERQQAQEVNQVRHPLQELVLRPDGAPTRSQRAGHGTAATSLQLGLGAPAAGIEAAGAAAPGMWLRSALLPRP